MLDDASGLKDAGAILAGFGVSDSALMDVVTGRFAPQGKLPFALARTLQAVVDNDPTHRLPCGGHVVTRLATVSVMRRGPQPRPRRAVEARPAL